MAPARTWGFASIVCTGAEAHLEKLEERGGFEKLRRAKHALADERTVYRELGLAYIEPELREGLQEVAQAAKGALPRLVTQEDIRGELHPRQTCGSRFDASTGSTKRCAGSGF
jgi:DNA polymerase (family 10)